MPIPSSATARMMPNVNTVPPRSGPNIRYQTSSIRKKTNPTAPAANGTYQLGNAVAPAAPAGFVWGTAMLRCVGVTIAAPAATAFFAAGVAGTLVASGPALASDAVATAETSVSAAAVETVVASALVVLAAAAT